MTAKQVKDPMPTRLLMVAMDDALAQDALHALRVAGFTLAVRRADDAAALAQALDDAPWDAVACHFDRVPGAGFEALATFRERRLAVPFVCLVDSPQIEAAVAATKAGASDYLPRRDLERLAPVLRRELALARERAHERSARRRVEDDPDRFVDLYEFAPVGDLTLGADGRVRLANATAAELLNRARDALVGVDFADLVHPTDVERWRQHLRRALSGPERRRVELRVRSMGDAPPLHVQADSRCVVAAGVPRLRMALTDISERKEAEASMRRFEAKLREVQKMESLGTLAGGIAHDFNNILGGILGNIELARDELPDGHRAATSLDEIRKASLRARDLVNQILMFSRREPQELVIQPLQAVMQETHRLLRATLPARVDLEFDLAPVPVHVAADATQLQQVLMNLCTNAWHALPDGAGHVRVALDAVALEAVEARRLGLDAVAGEYAHLVVQDDGIGMDALTLARIFEPFFTTKPVGQGTGLGLAVVHGIIAAHRGAIEVASAPGRGTTFHVYFPRRAAPPLAQGLAPSTLASPAPLRAATGRSVVYVDDDETMAIVVERLLLRAGYRVRCYTDAGQALAELTSPDAPPVDCVVTDFNMPGVSGLDIARTLASRRPGVPVVISTGYLSDELRSDARQLGVKALLQKQNTVQELADLVGDVLLKSVAG